MTTTQSPVDNGVNVEALLGVRATLARQPGDRPVPVAVDDVVGQRHAQPLGGRDVLRVRRGAAAPCDVQLRRRPPAAVRRAGQRRHAGGVRAGRPGRLPDRGHRRGGPAAVHPAAVGDGDLTAEMDLHGILGADPEVRNGFSGVTVELCDRCRRHRGGDQGAGRAVAEALRGLRHPDQPDRRHRRRGLIRADRPGGTLRWRTRPRWWWGQATAGWP